jgi:hypothetical protein
MPGTIPHLTETETAQFTRPQWWCVPMMIIVLKAIHVLLRTRRLFGVLLTTIASGSWGEFILLFFSFCLPSTSFHLSTHVA